MERNIRKLGEKFELCEILRKSSGDKVIKYLVLERNRIDERI